MKASRFFFVCSLLILAGGWPVLAQEKIGETVYLEGGVSLERNGQQLDPSEVQTGLTIENFDLVKTGADGLAEVSVDNPKAPGMTIKVSPRTAFSFELSQLGSKQRTSVGLMSGTISLKVQKLSSSQDMNINLDNAVMGVRGTELTVTTVPSGDLLLTCKTGDVVITDESGKELHAIPGTAVEKRFGEGFRPLAVTGADLEGFRKGWENDRVSALKAGALLVIQREAENYDRLVDEFSASYAALMEKREILSRWSDEEKNGAIGAGAEVEKQKAEIADLLASLRETQYLLERAHFRLAALRELHEQGFGRGDLHKGLSTKDFFDRFEQERPELERHLAAVRYDVKLFSHRNNGHDPTVVTDLKRFYEKRLAHRKLEQRRKLAKREK